jgi:hypothetical protein
LCSSTFERDVHDQIRLITGKLYIPDKLSELPVRNPEINTETIITIAGFLGAILLLLDVMVIR